MNKEPLIIEQEVNALVELVWRAITEKALMKKWFFDIANFRPEVGCKFHFEGSVEKRCYVHLGEVVELIPLKKLKYSWKYEGHAGLSFVTFELFPLKNKTLIKLTHEGLETLPSGNPDFARENFLQGWQLLIQKALKEFLEDGKSRFE